jgi:Fungal specific transcription factor domain
VVRFLERFDHFLFSYKRPDRGQPTCTWCSRNDQTCVYTERKKPGLRAGYGRDLERRLAQLEEMVMAHDRLFDKFLPTDPVTEEIRANSAQEDRRATGERRPQPSHSLILEQDRLAHNSLSDRSPGELGLHILGGQQLPHRSTQEGLEHQHTHPTSSNVTHVMLEGTAGADQPWCHSGLRSAIANAQGQLPPYDLLYSLVNLYFEHIDTWFPILHHETTLKALLGSDMLMEADIILLHAIVATTLRFCTDRCLTLEAREQYYDSSKQRVLLYGLENSSVRSLQAMVVLALDLTGSVNGPPAWNLLALIMRNTVHLGIAAESTSSVGVPTRPSISTLRATVLSEPAGWIEDEERRRLFWGAYILDRYATISTAFDFGLDEKEIHRRLPCDNEFFAGNAPVETCWFSTGSRSSDADHRPENLGSFAYYCELLGIISRIHQFLKRPVDIGSAAEVAQWQKSYRDLDDELTSWRLNLPEQTSESFVFQSSPESMNKRINSCWIMLHATCHTAVIRLHASAAYPTFRSTFFKPSYNAIQRCIRAAKSVEDLSRWVAGTSRLDTLGPPFAFSLWVAARVLLVHASTAEPNTSPDIGVFVSILSQMGRRWRVAERYGEILNRVVQEYQQSRLSLGSDENSTAATVKILADMRRLGRWLRKAKTYTDSCRCAYDLDVLISKQPGLRLNQLASAKPPPTNELEYLDVFDFFNMPRLSLPVEQDLPASPEAKNQAPLSTPNEMNELNITSYLLPNPESDWLMGETPFWT